MKNIFVCIGIFLFTLPLCSQIVTINGIAKTYENKEIGVWINNDYISKTQKELTYADIDSLGNFILEFNPKEIQYITFKIEKHITSMYVEPGANYEIMVLPPDSTTYQNPNIEHEVKLSIKLKSKTEINALTMDYDKRFDNFLSVDYKSFVSRRPQHDIDSFKVAMHEFYSTVKNPYFDAYITYTIASLEENTKLSEKKIFSSYISGKPVLYNHPEYMNFFNSFYKQKLQNFSLSKDGAALNFQINERGSYSGAMEALKKDIYLQSDTLRELVLIKGLYESYYDGTYQKKQIVLFLKQLLTESKIPEHQRIVVNILNSFSQLQIGGNAPYFELPDKTGLTHNLDELRSKKYIYLMFYDVNCSYCLQQMKVISSLKKKYGSRIEFVSVSSDTKTSELKDFCQKNPKYDWLFLYDNSNGKLKSAYEVRSLPAYFLISPEGKFIQIPAEGPDEDIDRAFFDITKPNAKTHHVGDKKNQ